MVLAIWVVVAALSACQAPSASRSLRVKTMWFFLQRLQKLNLRSVLSVKAWLRLRHNAKIWSRYGIAGVEKVRKAISVMEAIEHDYLLCVRLWYLKTEECKLNRSGVVVTLFLPKE